MLHALWRSEITIRQPQAAGNIGLGRVFTAAEKLERAIREVDSTVPSLAEEFTEVANCDVAFN
jgi:hypothetical protein